MAKRQPVKALPKPPVAPRMAFTPPVNPKAVQPLPIPQTSGFQPPFQPAARPTPPMRPRVPVAPKAPTKPPIVGHPHKNLGAFLHPKKGSR